MTKLKYHFSRLADARSVRSGLRNGNILSSVIKSRGDNVLIVHVPTRLNIETVSRLVSGLAGSAQDLPYSIQQEGSPLT